MLILSITPESCTHFVKLVIVSANHIFVVAGLFLILSVIELSELPLSFMLCNSSIARTVASLTSPSGDRGCLTVSQALIPLCTYISAAACILSTAS